MLTDREAHQRNSPVLVRQGQRQPRQQRILDLGLSLRPLLYLCLFPHSRDQGSIARAGRQDDGRDDSPQFLQMEAHDYLRRRDGTDQAGYSRAGDF